MKNLTEHLQDLENTWLFNDFEDEYEKNNYRELNEDELRRLEDDFYFSKYSSGIYHFGRSYPTYRMLLYERLAESLDSSLLIERLKELKHTIRCEHLIDSDTVVNLYVDDMFNDDRETYEKFESLLNFFNYFISRIIRRNDESIIRIEARKPKKIDTDKTLPFVYHITTKQAWEKIRRTGLSNKSHQKIAYHPKRTYCLSYKTPVSIVKMYAKHLHGSLSNAVILKIDTEKFKKDRSQIDNETLSFYGDPQTPEEYGMFTLEYIPTNYIEKIDI